jgi:hypothetical protein
MRYTFITLAAAISAVHGLKFTSQTKPDTTIDLSSGDITVTWTDYASAPVTSADLVLVNQAGGHTPFFYDFGSVTLSDGKYTISGIDFPSGSDYQFEFLATEPLNSGILCLTQQFAISGKASGASVTVAAGASTSVSAGSGSGSGSATTASSDSSSTGSSDSTTVSTSTTSSGSISAPTGSSTTSGGVASATSNSAVKNIGSGSMAGLFVAAVAALF